MDKVAQLQLGIHREAVDEENNRERRTMLDRIRKQVTAWAEVNEPATTISKSDLGKIASLIIAFNTALNKAVSDYVKSSNSDLLNFNVIGLETKYNDIVLYLQDIDFSNKVDSEKLKINNAFDELIPALTNLKNRFDGDADLSQNEKITVATILNNIVTHNYAPIGAYSRIDNVTKRDINEARERQRLADKLAHKQAVRQALIQTADNTAEARDQLRELNDEIRMITDASLASAAHLYDINENTDNIKRTGLTTAANTYGTNERLDQHLTKINKDLETVGVDLSHIRGNTETSANNSHRLVDNTQSLIKNSDLANVSLGRIGHNIGQIGLDVMGLRELGEKLDERIQAIQDRLEDLEDIKASSFANTVTGENTSQEVAKINDAMGGLKKELVKLQKQQEKVREATEKIADNTNVARAAPAEAVPAAKAAEAVPAARAAEAVPFFYPTYLKANELVGSVKTSKENPERSAIIIKARENLQVARGLIFAQDEDKELQGSQILEEVIREIERIKRRK